MANVIDDETIEYVGILAKLELSDEEKDQAKQDMAKMLANNTNYTSVVSMPQAGRNRQQA